MRSEKEGAGGPGMAVAVRGQSGRERTSAVEVQFRRESPRREAGAPSSSCGGSAGKPREEKRTVLSKVGVRPETGWGGGRRGKDGVARYFARGGRSSPAWSGPRTGGACKLRRIVETRAGKDAGWAERCKQRSLETRRVFS